MAKPGPKKLPSELRLLHGQTRAGQSVNTRQPQTTGRPVCPTELSDAAKVIWKRLLASMPPQLYARVDEAMLAAFCTAYAQFLAATVTVQAEGPVLVDRYGRKYEHPAARQMARTSGLITTLGDRLGLNPTARDQLKMPNDQPDNWEGLLR